MANAANFPSQSGRRSRHTNHWPLAEFGLSRRRAIATVPATNGTLLNSPFSAGTPEPGSPNPVPDGSPVWISTSGCTRNTVRPSYRRQSAASMMNRFTVSGALSPCNRIRNAPRLVVTTAS